MDVDKPVILLVDDYAINLELLEVYLQNTAPHAQLVKAMTGLEAMQAFWDYELDLVLMDVMLPDISGFELCLMMKEIRKDNYLPIVMITALHDKESLLEGLSSGADDFLTKPVNREELSIRVRNLLRLRSTTADLNDRYQQLSQELSLARSLLIDFMPQQIPNIPDVYLEVIYEPSSFIGGDFYDIIEIDDNHYGFFIADVKGHGVASAMMIAMLKEQLLQSSHLLVQPGKLFKRLNQNLCDFFSQNLNDYFITALYMVYDVEKKTMRWVNAGHNPVVYFCEEGFKVLSQPGGMPFGVFKEAVYEESVEMIKKRCGMIMYTDGIFELPLFYAQERTFANIEEILTMLKNTGILPTVSLLMHEIRYNIRAEDQTDDVNVIGLEF